MILGTICRQNPCNIYLAFLAGDRQLHGYLSFFHIIFSSSKPQLNSLGLAGSDDKSSLTYDIISTMIRITIALRYQASGMQSTPSYLINPCPMPVAQIRLYRCCVKNGQYDMVHLPRKRRTLLGKRLQLEGEPFS